MNISNLPLDTWLALPVVDSNKLQVSYIHELILHGCGSQQIEVNTMELPQKPRTPWCSRESKRGKECFLTRVIQLPREYQE